MKSSPATVKNLPWVERYRPNSLNELISHEEIIKTIRQFLANGRLPHLLFYGPPGTGKTSTILALAKELYTPQEFAGLVLELNASDDRGINVVRDEIVTFASSLNLASNKPKLIILDEADAMTKDAQDALRRVVEKYTKNARFCLIANYMQKIIPAIQSRTTRFRFGPLTTQQQLPRLRHVVHAEGVDATEDGLQALVTLSTGDMRKAINVLQCTHMAYKHVNAENVYACVGQPLPSEIDAMVKCMLTDNMQTAVEKLNDIRTLKSYAVQDILNEVHAYIYKLDLPDKVLIHLLEHFAELECRLVNTDSERLQLSSLVAEFMLVRDLIVTAATDSGAAAAATAADMDSDSPMVEA